MRPDGHAPRLRHPDRLAHDHRVTGMKTARHIGRRHKVEHGRIIADFEGTEAFTHVAIEIDLSRHRHPPPLKSPILLSA